MKRITITVKPTNGCNMRCKHCYHAEEGYNDLIMDVAYAKKMMDVALREYSRVKLVFHGGEPTMWGIDNFKDVLNYQDELIKKHPEVEFSNMIQTNGLLLDDEWIKLLKQYNFTVGISYDGPHNSDLREKSTQIYNAMKKMQAANLPFGVLCVETQKSINHLEETYEWFKKEGFNFRVLALFMSGTAKNNPDLELNIDDYVLNLSKMYKKWLYDKNCNISMRTFEDLLKVSDKLYCIQYGGSCIYNRICINPNGDIYPCGRPYTEDFVLGNILTLEKISDAYKTPAYQNIVEISKERIKQCKESCKFYGVCKGGCVSSAILEGTFDKINNTTCVRAKKLLSSITKINQEIYTKYDNKIELDLLNQRALDIMHKSRTGQYDFINNGK